MATAMFVWLGSGRAQRQRVGRKGALLDQAAHAGLPVPAGAILLDELRQFYLDKGLVENANGRLVVPDPELFHNTLFHSVRLPRFKLPVAVRSAYSINDGSSDAPDGKFSGCLDVDFNDAEATTSALTATWTGALSHSAVMRSDVLVMEMVTAECTGVALSCQANEADEVNVISGRGATASLSLPRLRGWRTPDAGNPAFTRRVQMLLRGVRRTFGDGDWEIEWIDDGRICWLMQVMPLKPQQSTETNSA